MIRNMLVPLLLLPGLGGCIFAGDRGRHHEDHRGHHERAVVHPVHAHGVGCGHVFRGGIWVIVS